MPMVVCKSRGDPHMTTFDRLSYDIYSTGNFIYVRNLSYPAVEVSYAPSRICSGGVHGPVRSRPRWTGLNRSGPDLAGVERYCPDRGLDRSLKFT